MGTTSSQPVHTKSLDYFSKKYNWVLSYPMTKYTEINNENFSKILNNIDTSEKKYIDLRVNCPPILNIHDIPVHPIASVCSMLNYQLNKNGLPTFPPSRLFIYHNCNYFPNVNSIISFESVFKSIEKYGFCSEIDFLYNKDNLVVLPSQKNYQVAEAFKFLSIYRIVNDIELIKIMLKHEMPLLIGIVLYTDLLNVIDKLWVPDLSIDKKIGGTTALIVGYSDDRECFFLKFGYGKEFGSSGYIMMPYNYLINKNLVPEIYYIDLKKNRINGFINQRRKTISLENRINEEQHLQKCDDVESFFG